MLELQAQLKEFIDSPEMFIQKLESTNLNVTKRNLNPGNEWHTRYFVTHDNPKKRPPSVLEAVRTHLRENLEYYSKDNLIQVYENLKKQNYEQAMKAILGKRTLPSDMNSSRNGSNSNLNRSDSKRMPPLTRENSDASSAFPSLSRSTSAIDPNFAGGFLSPEGVSRRPSLKDDSDQLPANLLSTILEGATETVSAPGSAVLKTPTKEEMMKSQAKPPSHSPIPEGPLINRQDAVPSPDLSIDSVENSSRTMTRSDVLQSRGMIPMNGSEETFQRPPDIIINKEPGGDEEEQSQGTTEKRDKKKDKSASPKKSRTSPVSTPKKGKLSTATTPTKGGGKDGKYNPSIASSNDSLSTNLAMATTSNSTPAGSKNAPSTAGATTTPANGGRIVMNEPPKVLKISDIKAPSKALQQFEEFLAQQQIPSKAASEGRKKANRTSRFRLPMMIANEERRLNNIHELINISEIQKDRLKMELTLFQALNPHYTPKDKEIFVKTFKQINPNVSLENIQHEVDHILSDLDYEEMDGKLNLLTTTTPKANEPQLLPVLGVSSRSPSPKPISRTGTAGKGPGATNLHVNSSSPGNKSSSTFFSEGEFQSPYSHDHTQWDETQQLTKWQEYTVQDIITTKDGERKTLPLITLPKSAQLPGQKFVQRGGHGVLIKMSAKKDEEPIEGPTSYLELYKSSFRVRISSKKREKVVRELKARMPQV